MDKNKKAEHKKKLGNSVSVIMSYQKKHGISAKIFGLERRGTFQGV